MKFEIYSHRHGEIILNEPQYKEQWNEVKNVLENITDEEIIEQFPKSSNKMSISAAINNLIKERLIEKGWLAEAAIFNTPEFTGADNKRWRLDFAKKDISIEVAFNHGEAIAWNLLKPVMASELNHVVKAIQTRVGIVIFATDKMKKAGAFDGAVGSYEKVLNSYMRALNNILTVPMVIIGLKAPETFYVKKIKNAKNKNEGKIIKNNVFQS